MASQNPADPSFRYHPSREAHEQRARNIRYDPKEIPTHLPPDYPKLIDLSHPLVWKGQNLQKNGVSWVFNLSSTEVENIEAALAKFQMAGKPLAELSPSTFPLQAGLRARLSRLADSLYDGIGFGVIRGIDPHKYSVKDNIIIHVGLTSYFGAKRGYMGAKGYDVLGHIRDIQCHFPEKSIISPSFTNDAMTFHTDLGDIVSIYAVNKGMGGGSIRLASSWNVYNELRATHPEVLSTLSQEFTFDTFHPDVPSYSRPLLHCHNGRVFIQSFRRPFTGFGDARRSADLPPVTDEQMTALDELHFAAEKDAIKLEYEDGDLLLFNNLAMLHARDKYGASQTGEQGDSGRHLLKLFVRDHRRAWDVPATMAAQWNELYSDRGNPRREEFPLEYPTGGEVPNYGWTQNG